MKKLLAAVLALCLLLALMPPILAAEGGVCEAMLRNMTTEEKLSQMLMLSLRTYEGDPVTELPDALRALLAKRSYGGVILFAENVPDNEQAARLTDELQRANAAGGGPQLLLAIDQEGGSVVRLGRGTAMPGNMALGAIGDPAETEAAAQLIGDELHALGIHVDFAPDADVNLNPANPVIGLRSFSDDPALAAEQSAAYLRGLRQAGVIGAPKHFPGHGDTDTDSHTGLPRVEKTKAELFETELVPFRTCIEEGAEMIMTAHIQYPQIETQTQLSADDGQVLTLPATLSPAILTDLLRGELGFDGVIVTDALNMGAVAKHFDPVDTVWRAITAGADLLLMPVDLSSADGLRALDRYLEALTQRAEDGLLPQDKLDAAVLRILRLKEAHGLLDPYETPPADASAQVGSAEHHAKERAIAEKAVTLLKNDGVLPIRDFSRKIVVLTAYDNEIDSMDYALGLLRDAGKLPEDADIQIHSLQSQSADTALTWIRGAGHVVAVSEAVGASYFRGEAAALLDTVLRAVHASGGKFTLVSAELPYDAARFPEADAILLCYGSRGMPENPRTSSAPVKAYGPNLPAALYLALTDDASPAGRVPVRIPKLDAEYRYTDETAYSRGSGLRYPGFEEEEAPAPEPAPSAEEPAAGQAAGLSPWLIAAAVLLAAAIVFLIRRRRK